MDMNEILDHIEVWHAVLLSSVTLILFVLMSFTSLYSMHHKRRRTNLRLRAQGLEPLPPARSLPFAAYLSMSLAIICATALVMVLAMYGMGVKRGASPLDMTLPKLARIMRSTPAEDDLPTSLDGCIVIFYRPGCPECEAIYPYVRQFAECNNDVYFVSTRSKTGEHLREQVPIEEVPVGVYFKKSDDEVPYVQAFLYSGEEGSGPFDRKAMDRLLQLQSEGR